MKKIQYYTLLLLLAVGAVGCDEYFEPNYNNNMIEETVMDWKLNPEYVEGLYVPAYGAIPGSYSTFGGDFLDCATDNAVSNSYTSSAWKMHTINGYYLGAPISSWGSRYRYIKDIFLFLSVGLNDEIVYRTSSPDRNAQLKKRMEGEANFLLALNYLQLLRDHAGPVDGVITGVPLIDKVISEEEAKELVRSDYDDVLEYLISKADVALQAGLLPEYTDAYAKQDDKLDPTIYGSTLAGLPTTTACHMLKSRALLYAASPAFAKGKSEAEVKELYRRAAVSAKAAIDNLGGLTADLYKKNTLDDAFFSKADENPELVLRRSLQTTEWEAMNYPPSLGMWVQGRTNPSQNLVDAFPMANGYPISNASSNYDSTDPYNGRDPRFYMTIIHNKSYFQNTEIEMWDGGNTQVGAANISNDSRVSRTNYYLRKWMTEMPSFIPGITSKSPWHFAAIFRAVEAYLNFAEAANAAVGPDVAINGLTAREALRAIRFRAGVCPNHAGIDADPYLQNASGEVFDKLVKNERRIELCFEGHRYYDIRRWNDDLNVKVRKATITTTNDGVTCNYNFNEGVYPTQATFEEKMRYGSIPRSEVLTCKNLKQNDGWY